MDRWRAGNDHGGLPGDLRDMTPPGRPLRKGHFPFKGYFPFIVDDELQFQRLTAHAADPKNPEMSFAGSRDLSNELLEKSRLRT